MLEGLLAAHRRYDELSAQLSQPDAASDIGRYRALMKEYKELEPLSRQYLAGLNNLREQARSELTGVEYDLLFGDGTEK